MKTSKQKLEFKEDLDKLLSIVNIYLPLVISMEINLFSQTNIRHEQAATLLSTIDKTSDKIVITFGVFESPEKISGSVEEIKLAAHQWKLKGGKATIGYDKSTGFKTGVAFLETRLAQTIVVKCDPDKEEAVTERIEGYLQNKYNNTDMSIGTVISSSIR